MTKYPQTHQRQPQINSGEIWTGEMDLEEATTHEEVEIKMEQTAALQDKGMLAYEGKEWVKRSLTGMSEQEMSKIW